MYSNKYSQMVDKIGIFVTSYIRTPERLNYVKEKLGTLIEQYSNCENVEFYLIDDGSPITDLVNDERIKNHFRIYVRPENGGIAKAKNTCLRLFNESDCTIAFLVDDDVEYKDSKGIFKYVSAIRNTKIPHLCAVNTQANNFNTKVNNHLSTSHVLNGYLFTVTKDIISKIGYFKILPNKYGHEHVNYTQRIVKAGIQDKYYDINKSEKHFSVDLGGVSSVWVSYEQLCENAEGAFNFDELYFPCIE